MKKAQCCPLADYFILTEKNAFYQKFIVTYRNLEMTVVDSNKKFKISSGKVARNRIGLERAMKMETNSSLDFEDVFTDFFLTCDKRNGFPVLACLPES